MNMTNQEREMLVRIDERTLKNKETLEKLYVKFDSLGNHFVKKSEFEPIQRAFYLASRIILVGLVSGILIVLGLHVEKLL